MNTRSTSTAVGRQAARALLGAGCVRARTDEPFRLPSGWATPVYMDCRRVISFPSIRRELVALGLDLLRSQGGLVNVASIAGGEASGIALAAWIADALDLPLQYVRKKPSGLTQVEGVIQPGDQVLLVDDLMAAGQSKQKFVHALRAAGASVTNAFVLFDYGTFSAAQLLTQLGVRAHSLANWHDVVAVAHENKTFDRASLSEVEKFLDDPGIWSQEHGGISLAQFKT